MKITDSRINNARLIEIPADDDITSRCVSVLTKTINDIFENNKKNDRTPNLKRKKSFEGRLSTNETSKPKIAERTGKGGSIRKILQ